MTRLPRPMTATALSRSYQADPSKLNKKKLRRVIIEAYIANQLFITQITNTHLSKPNKEGSNKYITNKKQENKTKRNKEKGTLSTIGITYVSIDQLSLGLGLSIDKVCVLIQKVIGNRAKKELMNPGYNAVQELNTRAHLNRLFFGQQQASTVHQNWVQELMAVARLKGYGALNVKEANSALTTALGYTKMELELLKAMSPQQPKTAIQVNQYGTQDQTDRSEKGMGLTTTMALELLAEKGLTTMPLDLDAIANINGLNDSSIPEIRALPEDAQGAKVFDPGKLEFLEHESRRVHQLGLEPGTVEPIAKKKKKVKFETNFILPV